MGVWKAFAEGKSPTYLKMDHLPEKNIRIIEKILWGSERTSRSIFHQNRDQDYLKPFSVELAFAEEIGACGGHSSSGVQSDVNGATKVSGLYVAGDVGTPFKKGSDWKNPESDEWMEAHLNEGGMKTPRRFMPQED